jgi:hypothetical protein
LRTNRFLDTIAFPLDHPAMSALEMIEILRTAPEAEIRLVRNAADALLAASGIQADEISEIKSACAEGMENYRRGQYFTVAQMMERLAL